MSPMHSVKKSLMTTTGSCLHGGQLITEHGSQPGRAAARTRTGESAGVGAPSGLSSAVDLAEDQPEAAGDRCEPRSPARIQCDTRRKPASSDAGHARAPSRFEVSSVSGLRLVKHESVQRGYGVAQRGARPYRESDPGRGPPPERSSRMSTRPRRSEIDNRKAQRAAGHRVRATTSSRPTVTGRGARTTSPTRPQLLRNERH